MRRAPSRLMPGFRRPQTEWWVWGVRFGLLVAWASLLWRYTVVVGIVSVVLVAAITLGHRSVSRELRCVALAREGESLCSFARSFSRASVDTWVVRAVYEQLQAELSFAHPAFPLRASDRLAEDLYLDAEDLDEDVLPLVAQRAGRSLEHTEQNPHFNRVHTVEDLVLFMCAQARHAA